MFISTAIVTCLTLILYGVFTARVALARAEYKINAPATSGHPVFERTFRIQQNTGEQLIITLPGLWMFSSLVSPMWGSLLGLVWIAGRIVYAVCYTRNPESRALGFVIGFLANAVLVLGSLVVAILDAVRVGLF
jgi:glutathione S-transferase